MNRVNEKKVVFIAILVALIIGGIYLQKSVLPQVAIPGLRYISYALSKESPENIRTTESGEEVFSNSIKSFEVSNVAGDITFIQGDSVKVAYEVKTNSKDSFENVEVVLKEEGSRLIARRGSSSGVFNNWSVNFTVTVPGDGELRNLYISTVSGEINIAENLNIEIADIHSTSGDISINSGEPFTLSTVSGEVNIVSPKLVKANLNSTSGKVEISSENPHRELVISSSTVSGDIKASIKGFKGFIDFSSVSGDFESNYQIKNRNESFGSLNGEVDSGVMSFEGNSVSGDILLKELP